DLEHVLRRLVRGCRGRIRRAGRAERRERGGARGPRRRTDQSRAVRRAATRLSIFSVAVQAAARWSEATPGGLDGRARGLVCQLITVSTSAPVLPPGGMRTL